MNPEATQVPVTVFPVTLTTAATEKVTLAAPETVVDVTRAWSAIVTKLVELPVEAGESLR